jgi:hypothetical protein
VGEAKQKRLSGCRCGSTRPAATCCLTGNGWHKKPAVINLHRTGESERHVACYMRDTNACCSKKSREHLISEAVLQVLAEKQVEVSGLPWLKGEKKVLTFSALTSNCLCRTHNSALSNLDAAGAKFFAAFQACGTADQGPDQHYLLSGHDLERWLLKTAAGLAASKNFAIDGARLEGALDGEMNVIKLLEDPRGWKRPLGLYAMQGIGYQFTRKDNFEMAPILKTETDQLAGIVTDIQGFQLGLLATDHPIRGTGLDKAIYRPGRLIFEYGPVSHTLQLSWDDDIPHINITISYLEPK